jgi:hypothetical protein
VRSLLVLSDTLDTTWPLVNETGVEWTSRFCSMWALAEEHWRTHRAEDGVQRGRITNWVVDDFLAALPDLVAIDAHNTVDYLEMLHSVPAFAKAWSSYDEMPPIPGFFIFERRRPRSDLRRTDLQFSVSTPASR